MSEWLKARPQFVQQQAGEDYGAARDRRILELRAQGKTWDEVAEALDLGVGTVQKAGSVAAMKARIAKLEEQVRQLGGDPNDP